ncbi:anthranilate phosphoribosyltransferase [Dongia mobilis]|uniref:Anthranilate phosphoribosyltransferase n=1 Tax=Dongia mobilis TaxID=578943 RepID=A0A4R6WHC0_9PROT|nr:anthranilate phosphoribosyltransferase [Dongia mobilis]TDQ77721.1 anthranilate phosphoribosyltransferase [Dongia mobilis]
MNAPTLSTSDLKGHIGIVAQGKPLTREQAESAFGIIMAGEATPTQIGGFLMALRVRGETVDEIAGAVSVMRSRMTRINAPADAIDVCGTGGDGAGTLNISTAVAFVCAASGVTVAKHGNKAASSKSGAADILTALGVNIDADVKLLEQALFEVGTSFLWAQKHHSAMRHVGPSRVELGTRTIFNLMGPMSNPAGVKRQLIGVFSKQWLQPMADALRSLGTEHAWLVHGSDGLDEITTTGPTHVVELRGGQIREFEITPEQFGLKRATLAALKGGSPEDNAAALRALFDGALGPYRDIVLLNAAAAMVVADRVPDIPAGIKLAAEALDFAKAREKLDALIRVTNQADIRDIVE